MARRLKNDDVVILAAKRSPIGKFQGAFKDWRAPQLAGSIIRYARFSANLKLEAIDRIIMGHVLSSGVGQHPALQAAIAGGIPHGVRAHSVNKVCASSLQALWEASHYAKIENELVVAGGMESMSQSPYLIERQRVSPGLGDKNLEDIMPVLASSSDSKLFADSMTHDGLLDAFTAGKPHMGELADNLVHTFPKVLVREEDLSRERQDEYAFESHRRAYMMRGDPYFLTRGRMGLAEGYTISFDEGVREPNLEKLRSLNPVFGRTITAGNASQLSDGAAALVVTSHRRFKELRDMKALARITCFADYSEPLSGEYTKAPVGATREALEKSGLSIGDIDLFEVNEAFAVVPLYYMRALSIPHNKVNIWGGAIAQGHPIGASGAIRVVSLIHSLRHTGGRYGLAVACHGGGGAVAVIIENLER